MRLQWILLGVWCAGGWILPVLGQGETQGSGRESVIREFGSRIPVQWGERVPGVKIRLRTQDKVLALTFDACSGKNSKYDAALIDDLIREQVPATLFITAQWMDKYPAEFKALAANPLFEIGNHGWQHRPCSVTGRSAYGLAGTRNATEVVDEIEKGSDQLAALTGRKPRWYRSGCAYYDEVGAAIAGQLGYQVAGFTVSGDGGGTFSAKQVQETLLSAPAGAIVLLHLNRPLGHTAAGVRAALPELKKRGFRFVRLSDMETE